MNFQNRKKNRCNRGFSLVELMVIVGVIGLLATLALAAFRRANLNAKATAVANDFRKFSGAFKTYNLNEGDWPDTDWVEGAYPTNMESYLSQAWIEVSPVGGYYVFHLSGTEPLILVEKDNLNPGLMERVDEILDDGDLGTGIVRGDNQSLDYYIR